MDIEFITNGMSGEYYLKVVGFNCENKLPQEFNSENISISCNGIEKKLLLREPTNQMYSDLHDFIYNIGYIENPFYKVQKN